MMLVLIALGMIFFAGLGITGLMLMAYAIIPKKWQSAIKSSLEVLENE
jgi:hypothetical protein